MLSRFFCKQFPLIPFLQSTLCEIFFFIKLVVSGYYGFYHMLRLLHLQIYPLVGHGRELRR